jgi:hypothetical protein
MQFIGPLLRILSIIAYLLIFLQGSIILIPFGCLLVTGVFTAEPIMKILLGLADISLIVLLIVSLYKRTRWTVFIELVSFFVLLLPLLKIFLSFSFVWFNYFLFLFPLSCFIVFFPLSIFIEQRKYNRDTQNLISSLNF